MLSNAKGFILSFAFLLVSGLFSCVSAFAMRQPCVVRHSMLSIVVE